MRAQFPATHKGRATSIARDSGRPQCFQSLSLRIATDNVQHPIGPEDAAIVHSLGGVTEQSAELDVLRNAVAGPPLPQAYPLPPHVPPLGPHDEPNDGAELHEAFSPISRRSPSRHMSHPPPSSPVDRGTPARTADGRGSRRSLRKRPVVEITARAKPARHAGKRVRFTTSGESSASDTEWVPSVSHESSESDGEDNVKDNEPPTKKRKRSTASRPDPPPKQTPTVYQSPTPSPSDAKISGSATRNYTRKTDRDRHAFTTLHGDIRCIFCPITSSASKPRGTIHRLPDAAARHLREFCAHFEKSHVYQQHRGADPSLSKKDIVARLVRQYEKIAVAQVHCRQNADYRRRCAALGLSPANVESRLARHAVLYKIEDCECCPLPRYSKYLASLGKSEDTMSGEAKKQKKRTKQPRTYKDKETRAEDREVIEILDDDDALVKDDEVVKVKREDIKMEDAAERGNVKMDEAAEERGFDEAETHIEEVKEEIKEEEEEVVIREVHIKVSKSQPRVKIDMAVKQEEGMEESVKEEGEGVRTVPMTCSRRVRMKQEGDP